MLTALIVGAIAAALAAAASGKAARFFDEILATWRRALARTIDDPDKLAAAQAQLAAFEQDAAELAAHGYAGVCELAEVQHRYDSTLADYDAVIDALAEQLYVDQVRLVDRVHELRVTIGDDAYLRIMTKVEADLAKAKAKRERKQR